VVEERVATRRRNHEAYVRALGDVPGIAFQPEAPWGRHTRWLSNILIDPREFGADREAVRRALAAEGIESRPLWKPMHTQPVFAGCEAIGGGVAEELFERGLSLPSGSTLSEDDRERVVGVIRRCVR
jgi:dTDP-4-amino-4,6-dideoxygalactose transaminase